MISISNLNLGFRARTLLAEVSTDFPQRCLTALIGRNGTGKSTLLRALAGLNNRYTGDILIDGSQLRDLVDRKWPGVWHS